LRIGTPNVQWSFPFLGGDYFAEKYNNGVGLGSACREHYFSTDGTLLSRDDRTHCCWESEPRCATTGNPLCPFRDEEIEEVTFTAKSPVLSASASSNNNQNIKQQEQTSGSASSSAEFFERKKNANFENLTVYAKVLKRQEIEQYALSSMQSTTFIVVLLGYNANITVIHLD
jgi:hypothetical protein